MNKHHYALAALLTALMAGSAQAQHGYNRFQYEMLDEARSMMEAGQWSDAYRLYKPLLAVDTSFADVYLGIGVCEANLPDKRVQATGHLEAAVRHGSVEGLYQLALDRHRHQRFTEEIALLDEYRAKGARELPNAEVERQASIARNAISLTADSVHLRIRNLGTGINSAAHDYCPLATADGNTLYFTSRRPGSMGGLRDANGQYYEDIYTSHNEDGIWSRAKALRAPVNSDMQDATVGLSPDGNEMVIYRASDNQPDGDLYITQRAQGAWQEPERMTDRINSEAHEPSATISPDGTEIYFSSDRKGGFGGRDLYRIRRLPNGEWSLPLNLGPAINTPYDEDAPFMHSDGTTLFFSSNGHNTMGGFDIFKASLLDPDMNVWDAPVNMGYPLNTVNDDIYFCLSQDGKTGYFSSEREGGLGGQDIYQVVFPSSQIDFLLVRGVVTDATEKPLRARIVLTRSGSDDVYGIYNTNANTGRYVMAVKPGHDYHLRVTAEGYAPWENDLHTNSGNDTGEMALDIPLSQGEQTAGNTPQPR
jgi:hypothetical protein